MSWYQIRLSETKEKVYLEKGVSRKKNTSGSVQGGEKEEVIEVRISSRGCILLNTRRILAMQSHTSLIQSAEPAYQILGIGIILVSSELAGVPNSRNLR